MSNPVRKETSLIFIAKIIILYYSVSPFLYLIRTLSGDTGISAVLLRVSQPILFFFTFLFCFLQNKFKLNTYSLILLLIGFYGLLIAIFQQNKTMDMLAGVLHFMTGIMVFIYFYNSNELNIDKFMRFLSYSALICYSLVIGFIYCLPWLFGFRIYLGLACQVLIIVFFYNVQKKNYFLSLLSVLLILISGKRGVFVALLLGFLISLLPLIKKLNIVNALQIMAFIAIGTSLVLFTPISNEQLLHKYTFSEKTTVDDYSAGRFNEILSAYESWTSSLENIIIGSGFGFNYTYVHHASKIADTEDYKNIHFSYLNPLIILGVPIALIYYACLFFLFIKLFQNVKLAHLKWASITYLIYACFVFNLFDEPIFWMINGLLGSWQKREDMIV